MFIELPINVQKLGYQVLDLNEKMFADEFIGIVYKDDTYVQIESIYPKESDKLYYLKNDLPIFFV